MLKVLLLVEDGYEDLEFYYPYLRLLEEGFDVIAAAPKPGVKTGKNGTKIEVKQQVKGLEPDQFAGVFIPGGYAPDKLRRYPEVLNIVKKIHSIGGIVGSICHGPHVLISAGLVKGKKVTSFHSIKDDLINAGAEWVDEPVVVDERIVTSRAPTDLPKMLPVFIGELKKVKPDMRKEKENLSLPKLDLRDDSGRRVKREDLLSKYTVLYFFPKAGTPGCTQEAQDFNKVFPLFRRRGVKLVGVSPDSPERLRRFKEKYGFRMRFLSDPKKKLAKAFGVIGEDGRIVRSTFILDSAGNVIKAWRGVRVKGHVDKVSEEIKKLTA